MSIDAKTVKELREKTGCGFMDCKAALKESDGDLEAAVEYLRKKGMAAAAKKAGRKTDQGLIVAHLADNGRLGSLVEVNCETDFVARTEDFQGLVGDLARQAAEAGEGAEDVETMLGQPFIGDSGQTVQEAINAAVGKLGENMRLRRFVRFAGEGEGVVDAYIHPGSRIGVLIDVGCEKAETAGSEELRNLVRDLAMQVAAASPGYLSAEDIPEEVVSKEKEILMEQARESGKPEHVLDKIVTGRMVKYFEEICLLDQKFVKDTDRRVKDVIGEAVKKLGENIKVHRFQRFQLGED